MDPKKSEPMLAVIDSGSTVMLLPSRIFSLFVNELAHKFKDDHSVNMICTQATGETTEIDVCFFQNTTCEPLLSKVEPIKFFFDHSVFELQSQSFLKDDMNGDPETNERIPACVINVRSNKDGDRTDDRRFLMGNEFLKNFYSVYDYDW